MVGARATSIHLRRVYAGVHGNESPPSPFQLDWINSLRPPKRGGGRQKEKLEKAFLLLYSGGVGRESIGPGNEKKKRKKKRKKIPSANTFGGMIWWSQSEKIVDQTKSRIVEVIGNSFSPLLSLLLATYSSMAEHCVARLLHLHHLQRFLVATVPNDTYHIVCMGTFDVLWRILFKPTIQMQ